MDHLGITGSLFLLDKLGFDLPADDFIQWAIQQLPPPPAPLPGRVMRTQIYAVAEYSIRSSSSGSSAPPRPKSAVDEEGQGNGEVASSWPDSPLEGALLYQSGYKAEEPREGPGWLSDIALPISRYVDRSLCAEFQLLSELIELQAGGPLPGTQDQAMRQGQKGRVDFWVTQAPCLSCISALLQYQALFPGVKVCFAIAGHLAPGSGPVALESMEQQAPPEAEQS